MAAKKKTEAKEPVVPDAVQRDQFANVNDWPLFRPKDLYRVKRVDDEYLVVSKEGFVERLTQGEFDARFEPVKGPHKREF